MAPLSTTRPPLSTKTSCFGLQRLSRCRQRSPYSHLAGSPSLLGRAGGGAFFWVKGEGFFSFSFFHFSVLFLPQPTPSHPPIYPFSTFSFQLSTFSLSCSGKRFLTSPSGRASRVRNIFIFNFQSLIFNLPSSPVERGRKKLKKKNSFSLGETVRVHRKTSPTHDGSRQALQLGHPCFRCCQISTELMMFCQRM